MRLPRYYVNPSQQALADFEYELANAESQTSGFREKSLLAVVRIEFIYRSNYLSIAFHEKKSQDATY
ncbi:hypothetical protein OAF34_07105 [Pirellulaceae bacterium]|jgi:hypothetical protein|nr:hypothetical protein [Pirellulaceae bacterium]